MMLGSPVSSLSTTATALRGFLAAIDPFLALRVSERLHEDRELLGPLTLLSILGPSTDEDSWRIGVHRFFDEAFPGHMAPEERLEGDGFEEYRKITCTGPIAPVLFDAPDNAGGGSSADPADAPSGSTEGGLPPYDRRVRCTVARATHAEQSTRLRLWISGLAGEEGPSGSSAR